VPAAPAGTPDVWVILPTYNEAENLERIVAAVLEQLPPSRKVLVVDDNSPDGTGQVADELAAAYPIRVLHRAGKLGLGTAVVAGFNAAEGEIVGVIDADLSHPPSLVPRMLDVMQRTSADIVIASRYIPGGGTANWELSRVLMSRFACLLARRLTPVRDATSGFFLMRRDLARGVTISAGGFKICLELLIRSEPRLVVEVPYVFTGRTAGESKMNLKEAVGYLRQLRDLHAFRRTRRLPQPAYRRMAAL
jgi:dolichol-phosphate mannosyltransferase